VIDYKEIQTIRKLYKNKKNIMNYFRKKYGSTNNSDESILYSYDLQAGSYYSKRNEPKLLEMRKSIGKILTNIISEYGAKSVLEAGCGEGNTLAQISNTLIDTKPNYYGFDISLSRILFAQKYLSETGKKNFKLFTAAIENIPLANNSVDIVFTCHALEPNHGREQILLSELFRITRRYLVLIEPTYELGSKLTRKHIEKYGYVRDLPKIIKKMDYNIIKHELLGLSSKYNENALIITEKKGKKLPMQRNAKFVSPISLKPLKKHKNYLYCKHDGFAFPEINEIPCLLKSNGILASKLHLL